MVEAEQKTHLLEKNSRNREARRLEVSPVCVLKLRQIRGHIGKSNSGEGAKTFEK